MPEKFRHSSSFVPVVPAWTATLKMNLQIGCTNCIETSVLDAICVHGGKFAYTVQEEDIAIDYEISEGGAEQ